jgi:hypothetical protein
MRSGALNIGFMKTDNCHGSQVADGQTDTMKPMVTFSNSADIKKQY